MDPALATFDPSDRKFIAVARASGLDPDILQATDSKWWQLRDDCQRCGLKVVFLCQELDEWNGLTTVVAAFPALLERLVGAGNLEENLMGSDSMKSPCEGSLGRDDDLQASGAASRSGPHLSPNGWTNRSPRGAGISPATDSSGLRLWS
jgi:hypothetical protein